MVGELLNTDRLRRIIMVAARRARAIVNWYLEAGSTQSERRGINLLKEWLSPEQLVQFESYRYFDVIGRQSGKRYRIRYGTAMNVCEMDSRCKTFDHARQRLVPSYRRLISACNSGWPAFGGANLA